MTYSNRFIWFNWFALILIFLVVFAGSFVRITGSGMGCPDWPKCFGKIIPPTDKSELPENYREIYGEKRAKKLDKFCRFLTALGMKSTADKIKADPDVLKEEKFNARKTWTEYINRLVGFLAGNALLIAFVWMLIYYRSKLVLVAGLNLVILLVEAWFGSIVVATNLVPWTITLHLFLALVIIGIQLYLLHCFTKGKKEYVLANKFRWIIWVTLAITFYQMFLGTQVRESIDFLVKQGFERSEWIEKLGLPFIIHRSFSWFVLILITYLAYFNEKTNQYFPIRILFITLFVELISGILLAYWNVPGLVQTSHLIFASLLFGELLLLSFRTKVIK